MTDADLIDFAAEFRAGILGDWPSQGMCAAVSWPLVTLLNMSGVNCRAVECENGVGNHIYIALDDGRVLDPTADQFNFGPFFKQYPPVYLGAPTELHGSESVAA